ncbi:Thiamine-phosphate synthase [Paenibacillus plantiphilus]|uniref:Thiamine-phosphate synthase n=1 Tax=Paenibacillus plantiphilus TaxID=2905650 RepID=A0ABM9CRX8_9BACL|nr:thiamine phosphate synthase [Paenibacillus plantiphilus]CAH1221584.1 Thiamine-phosphate synthase [Paenibacillus plantiphilus]
MKRLNDCRLYVITGENYHPGRTMLDVMEQALIGGADIVQLRAKDTPKREVLAQAYALRELTQRYEVPFIVNDHLDIALAVGADGVHLGQDDLPLAEARRILGPDKIIGISTHGIKQALEAERGGADYIGVGPVYPTGTKPGRTAVTTDYVREAAERVKLPFVAIGGITLDNVNAVLDAGAAWICAVSAIVGSEDVAGACRSFLHHIRLKQIDSMISSSRKVCVNGREERTTARTVLELVEQLNLRDKRIVVELNGEIVPIESWVSAPLTEGAVVELVHFVGGG